jgi:hypothetical protein
MNDILTRLTPPRLGSAILALLIAIPVANAAAQDLDAKPVKELAPVTIKRTKNPGDLPYAGFRETFARLQSFLPPEPRVLDMKSRLSFTGLSESERDAYLPDTWAVAIVGDTIDHTIDIERGGYFVLPELEEAAKEKATIMFNAQTRKNFLNVAWKFRIAPGQTLPYADFAKAFDEVASVQKKIPLWRISLREERLARFDGLKACFHPGKGRIEVDRQPAATTSVGACEVLRFDPALARNEHVRIAFIGPLGIVTLNEVLP